MVASIRRMLVVLCLAMIGLGSLIEPAQAGDDFLDPEVAFTLQARPVDDRRVELLFTAAPGYYLYRDQFKFSATGAALESAELPAGKVKFDETFQKSVETYRGEVRIVVPVRSAPSSFLLLASHQGCADKGLCYPPMQRAVRIGLSAFGGNGTARVLSAAQTAALGASQTEGAASPAGGEAANGAGSGSVTGLDAALRGGRFWSVVGVFFIAGLLLSLTPCVLPMLPILSAIIVGQQGQASRRRGLALAVSYSLGMALVYTTLGIFAGLAGEGLAAALQNPWVLSLFAAGLVALALSMFGIYQVQLPAGFTGRLAQASQRLPAGRVAGVFAMGGVSALIVSPCVAAPLAGALVYLSQTGDVWIGGTALFCLAAGMSVPLMLVGASAGTLLPAAGAWMEDVKRVFGLLLLGVALWTVQTLLPGRLALASWGVLAFAAAAVLFGGRRGERPPGKLAGRPVARQSAAAVLAAVGVLQLVGAASGGSDPLQPLAHLSSGRAGASTSELQSATFAPLRSVAELDAALRSAGRPVLLDFYADWCVSCKEMERFTFADPAVQARLAGAVLLRVDVTANSADDRALLRRFNLFGPPGTIVFDTGGQEVAAARVIGFQNSERFLQTLASAGL